MTAIEFVDVSNLQPPLTQTRLDAFWAAGKRGIAVGLQYPGPAYPAGNAHLNFAAIEADVGHPWVRAAYFESTDPARSINLCGIEHLRKCAFLAIAVEQGSGFEDEASIDAAVKLATALGPKVILYGSPYEQHVLGLDGVTIPFMDGWVADYDGVSSTDGPSFLGTHIIGKQYSEHGQIPGLDFEVDLSLIEVEDAVQTTPVVNADAIAFIQAFVAHEAEIVARQNGAALDVDTSNPKRFVVTLP